MDIFEWLLNNGTTLNGAVIIRLVILGFIIEFFGICVHLFQKVSR